MENRQFEITNKKGEKILCDVIATYHDVETEKDFIVYTDKTYDAFNKLNVYYSLYEIKNSNIKLRDITEIKDKKIGLELIKEIINDIEE